MGSGRTHFCKPVHKLCRCPVSPAERLLIVPIGDTSFSLVVGNDDWPMPIALPENTMASPGAIPMAAWEVRISLYILKLRRTPQFDKVVEMLDRGKTVWATNIVHGASRPGRAEQLHFPHCPYTHHSSTR